MSEDQTLGDTTPPPNTPGGNPGVHGENPFVRPTTPPVDLATPARQLTIEEILEQAKLPETTVYICLRADLQARYDQIVEELSGLVTASGELTVDPEATIGDQTAASRAQQLADDLDAVRREMSASMVPFRFRGMSADDLAVFEKAHRPKSQDADFTPYFVKLIASCAIEPAMTEAQVKQLRGKFGARAFLQLSTGAQSVNTGGGVDVPKSLSFSQVRAGS